MRNNLLLNQSMSNKNGVTLIELLVVLVISVIVIGGVYRVFIAQTRAYTVQDQVAEVQQDVRSAMEIMSKDIRMAGFQTNDFAVTNPAGSALVTNTGIHVDSSRSDHITVNYQYIPPTDPNCTTLVNGVSDCVTYTVDYQLAPAVSASCPNPPCLQHTCTPSTPVANCTGVADILLTNVTSLNFSYGVDADGDGTIDNMVNGTLPNGSLVSANNVGIAKVLAVRIQLTAKPVPVDPDVKTTVVSPRVLDSVVSVRNMFLKRRYTAY